MARRTKYIRKPTYIARGSIRQAIINSNEPKYTRDNANVTVVGTTDNTIPDFAPVSGSGMLNRTGNRIFMKSVAVRITVPFSLTAASGHTRYSSVIFQRKDSKWLADTVITLSQAYYLLNMTEWNPYVVKKHIYLTNDSNSDNCFQTFTYVQKINKIWEFADNDTEVPILAPGMIFVKSIGSSATNTIANTVSYTFSWSDV